MSPINDQLARVLSTYCTQMGNLRSLATSVQNGAYPWLRDEFAQALREGAFTIPAWNELILVDYDDDDYGAPFLDEDLREVWQAIAPSQPYPLDRQD